MELTLKRTSGGSFVRSIINEGVTKVSLSSNGLSVRVYDAVKFNLLCEITSPEWTAHTDDAKTSLEVEGFVRSYAGTEWHKIRLELE
jgi:hypothetical protein